MHQLTIPTSKKEELIEITEQVQDAISRSSISEGICTVFIPHTTAGVTVNENADPSVRHDFIYALRTLFSDLREFTHSEGNSPAHIKASLVGPSQTLLVRNGALVLGTWQGVYLCEFDGPRTRRVLIDVRK